MTRNAEKAERELSQVAARGGTRGDRDNFNAGWLGDALRFETNRAPLKRRATPAARSTDPAKIL